MARHQRRRALDRVVVEVGPGLAANLDDIAEAGSCQQCSFRAAPLENQIGDDGRAMAEEGDCVTRCTALLQQCRDPTGYGSGRVRLRRGQFEMPSHAASVIDRYEIGESAADSYADPDNSCTRTRTLF